MIDQARFRQTIGCFATGVTVVTTRHSDQNYGMTLSAMTSLCLDPPMLLICVNKSMPTHDAIQQSGCFAVNILADHQARLARQFARPAPDKFANIETVASNLGAPLIVGALAHFACRVTNSVNGGTHTVFIASVEYTDTADQAEPLLYYRAKFSRCHMPSLHEKDAAPQLIAYPGVLEGSEEGEIVPERFNFGMFCAS